MIRRRLAAAIIGVVAVTMALATTIVLARLEDRLIADVDTQLRALANFLEPNQPFPRLPRPGPKAQGQDADRSPFDVRAVAFLRVDSTGKIVADSPTGPQTDPEPLPDITGLRAPAGPVTVGSDTDPELRFRVRAVPTDDGGMFVLGMPLTRVDAAITSATEILVIASALTVVVLAALVWFAIRRGLRPIEGMITTADRIAAGDLTERTTVPNPATEVGHLGAALNTMLDRIEDAVTAKTASEARLRRFVADASHELRTPLTSIRGYAELYRQGATDTDSVALGMLRIEREATRMGDLVEDLLLLARSDQGHPIARHPVDLVALIGDAVTDARVVEPRRRFHVDLPPGAVVATGDHALLRQVLDNLIANIREHANPDSSATVRLTTAGDIATMTVADDGPGMSTEDAANAFDRFWQADPDPRHPRPGAGLGLAIVHDLVTAHDGAVTLDTTGPGLTVTITLRL